MMTAEELNVDRTTLYDFVKKHRLESFIKEINELNLDRTESKLLLAIKAGEPWAIKFMLSTKGKHRGYTERMEVTGADGAPVTVKLVADGKMLSML
jgi:hypothetical protein